MTNADVSAAAKLAAHFDANPAEQSKARAQWGSFGSECVAETPAGFTVPRGDGIVFSTRDAAFLALSYATRAPQYRDEIRGRIAAACDAAERERIGREGALDGREPEVGAARLAAARSLLGLATAIDDAHRGLDLAEIDALAAAIGDAAAKLAALRALRTAGDNPNE